MSHHITGLRYLIRSFLAIPAVHIQTRNQIFGLIQSYANKLYLEGHSFSQLKTVTKNNGFTFEEYAGSLLVHYTYKRIE